MKNRSRTATENALAIMVMLLALVTLTATCNGMGNTGEAVKELRETAAVWKTVGTNANAAISDLRREISSLSQMQEDAHMLTVASTAAVNSSTTAIYQLIPPVLQMFQESSDAVRDMNITVSSAGASLAEQIDRLAAWLPWILWPLVGLAAFAIATFAAVQIRNLIKP